MQKHLPSARDPVHTIHLHSISYVQALHRALLVSAVVVGAGAVAAWRLIVAGGRASHLGAAMHPAAEAV